MTYKNRTVGGCVAEKNEMCFRPRFGTLRLYWAGDRANEMNILLWIMPLVKHHSLDLLTGPAVPRTTTVPWTMCYCDWREGIWQWWISKDRTVRRYDIEKNEWYFRPQFCTVRLYWASEMKLENHGQLQNRSLNLLTCSPALYHCALATPGEGIK